MKMSPEPLPEMLPLRPSPERDPPGEPFQLMREERCVGRDDDDDGAELLFIRGDERIRLGRGNFATHVDARDAQIVARSVVALDEDTDRVAAVLRTQASRGGADAALVAVADHPGAAADAAFLDRTAVRAVERAIDMLGLDVKAVDVVQPPVPGFCDHGQRPPVVVRARTAVRHPPLYDGIAHDADAVRIGDHHGPVEKARLLDPGGAGHLAIAVLREPGGEDRIGDRVRTARQDGRDAGAHGPAPDFQLARARR